MPRSSRLPYRRLGYGLLFIIAVAGLSTGGSEPYALSLTMVLLGALYFVAAIFGARGQLVTGMRWQLQAGLGLFGLIICWMLFQASSISVTFFGGGLGHPAWQLPVDQGLMDRPRSISATPELSQRELLWFIVYAMVFCLTYAVGKSSRATHRFLRGFVYLGLFFSFVAICVIVAPQGSVLASYSWAYPGNFTATFTNRNSFATFIGMAFICAVVLLIEHLHVSRFDRASDGRSKLWVFLRSFSTAKPQLIGACVILAFILLGTGSRAGVGAALFGVIIACVLMARKTEVFTQVRKTRALVAIGGIALTVFVLTQTVLGTRLESDTLSGATAQRADIYRISLDMWLDRPLLGHGLGSYAAVNPMYQDAASSSPGVLINAHNTYLELLIELGTPAALAIFALVGMAVWLGARPAFRRNEKIATASVIVTATSAQVGLHSLVDFSLEIPAITMAYMAFLGLGVGQALRPSR